MILDCGEGDGIFVFRCEECCSLFLTYIEGGEKELVFYCEQCKKEVDVIRERIDREE